MKDLLDLKDDETRCRTLNPQLQTPNPNTKTKTLNRIADPVPAKQTQRAPAEAAIYGEGVAVGDAWDFLTGAAPYNALAEGLEQLERLLNHFTYAT